MQMVAIMSYTTVVPRGCPRSNLCMYYVRVASSSLLLQLLLAAVCVLLLGYEPTEQRRCTTLSSKRVHQRVNHTS